MSERLAIGAVALLALAGALRKRGSRGELVDLGAQRRSRAPDPDFVLLPPGQNPLIGEETGQARKNGIGTHRSPHGSVRYLWYEDGQIVSGLQVVSRDGQNAVVAYVYTTPPHRRRGLASKLMKKARSDFQSVEHAKQEHLSQDAKAWIKGSRSQPGYMPPFGGVRKRQVFDEAQGGNDQNPMRDIDRLLAANRDPTMELGYVLDWLADERAGGSWGANTYWYGRPYPQLSVEKLLELPGQKGQHRHMGTAQQGRFSDAYIDKLSRSIKSQGFDPDSAIQVFTWGDGTAKIWEGNHRLRAAKRAGLQTIPVDWRYVAGSERDPTATHASEFAP